MNGLDAARAILKEHPSAAILMLSVHLPGQLAVEARKSESKALAPIGNVVSARRNPRFVARRNVFSSLNPRNNSSRQESSRIFRAIDSTHAILSRVALQAGIPHDVVK